jgi:hypothetical protein
MKGDCHDVRSNRMLKKVCFTGANKKGVLKTPFLFAPVYVRIIVVKCVT